MSVTTMRNNAGSTPLPEGVDDLVTWIKVWLNGPPFTKDVLAIPVVAMAGLGSGQITGSGQQPGVYTKLNDVKGRFFSGALAQKGYDVTGCTGCVILNTLTPDSGSTLWCGLIFHEYGHAAIGADEPSAWTVELLSLQAYLATKSGVGKTALETKLGTFVKGRRKEGCYTGFVSGYEVAAKAACAALAGEAFA